MTQHRLFHDQLALDGAMPVRRLPLPNWPSFGDEEVEATARVLRSGKVNYWTGGETRRFEREFAEAVGCRYGVAVANGTLALEAALAALGIGPGDEVIVTCRSFIASASCCVMRGARPVFADVDPNSQNVTAETVAAVLSPQTRAILAVHLAGWPCEMDAIADMARRHGLAVIEDCAQGHGATYRGRPIGSLGDVAAFSFCQDKIMTSGGEGGMVVTNRDDLWERAWSLKDHGKSWHAVHQPRGDRVFQWLHESIGTNWRMTEMQGAIGRIALRRLPQWSRRRRQHALRLAARLSALPSLRVPMPPAHVEHAYYKFYAFLRPEWLSPGWSRDRVVRAIQAEGIPCGSGICPEIYREKAFDQPEYRPASRLPEARRLGETSLMFQVHPTLSRTDIDDTALAIEKVLAKATASLPHIHRRAA